MDSQADRDAFVKASAYLNYHAGAKWAAYLAAVASAIFYVGLLAVLWLFADLLVYRGQIPSYRALMRNDQERFLQTWSDIEDKERKDRLEAVGFSDKESSRLAGLGHPPKNSELSEVDVLRDLDREDLEKLWRAEVGSILETRVNEDARNRVSWKEQPNYDEQNNGILSLVVRSQAHHSYLAPIIAWLSSWNSWWAWNSSSETPLVPRFLLGLLVLGFVLALLMALAEYLMREMAARATIEASNRLRRAVYLHTFRLGTLAFRALGPTEAVTVFTRHAEAVHDALYARLTVYFREAVKFGLLLAFALLVHPLLAVAFLIVSILLWILGGQMIDYFNNQATTATNQASESLTIMRESLMMMRLVKCYLMEGFNRSRVERQLAHYSNVQMIRYRGEAIYQPLLILIGIVSTLLLLFVAGVIILAGHLGVPGMIALATALVSLYPPLQKWIESRRLLKRGRDSSEQLFKFLERRGDVGQVIGAEFLEPLNQGIEFDNVSLREPGSNRMLLEEVSLTIPAGKRIGLIGAEDLEKHALVYLIPRLLDPTSGEIRIDQHNLRWVTLDSLRNQIATVLQHNLVFHDTVANNISCGDPAYTLPQIIEAAKIAHAHHFIQKLPQGYETPIGELGHSLSNSQQYRIALARAILRDPALLIIEEPDSSMDEDTKSLLDDTMARILPGRTAIFLPHRISTIRSCDRLYLLHRGRIAATGVHKELLSANPLYRHLHYLEFNEIADQI